MWYLWLIVPCAWMFFVACFLMINAINGVMSRRQLRRPMTPSERLRALRIVREYKNQGSDVIR
jgi:hypothetical protein